MAVQKGQIALIGFHISKGANPALPSVPREYVVYPVAFPTMADGENKPGKIQIDANYDFVWLETAHSCNVQGNPFHVPLRVQITPAGGRPVFREAVYVNAISAPDMAAAAKKNPVPVIFKATETVRFDFYADAAEA